MYKENIDYFVTCTFVHKKQLVKISSQLPHSDHCLTLTGHSLGGAIASLYALSCLRAGYFVELVTFGAPMVGDDSFESIMTRAANYTTVSNLTSSTTTAKVMPSSSSSNFIHKTTEELIAPSLGSFSSLSQKDGSLINLPLLRNIRVVNPLDVVPLAQKSLNHYVHVPRTPIVLGGRTHEMVCPTYMLSLRCISILKYQRLCILN